MLLEAKDKVHVVVANSRFGEAAPLAMKLATTKALYGNPDLRPEDFPDRVPVPVTNLPDLRETLHSIFSEKLPVLLLVDANVAAGKVLELDAICKGVNEYAKGTSIDLSRPPARVAGAFDHLYKEGQPQNLDLVFSTSLFILISKTLEEYEQIQQLVKHPPKTHNQNFQDE